MPVQINNDEMLYTYRNGQKVYLNKKTDQFIVREKPADLAKRGITKNVELVSSASSRVTVPEDQLDPMITELRKDVVTHHAYTQEKTGTEFLITDRILVAFKLPVSNDTLNGFMAKYALLLREKYSDTEFLFQLSNQTGMNPVKLVVLISETEQDLVETCEHDLNKRMMKMGFNVPNDAKYMQQWHLHTRLMDASVDQRSSSKCEQAWNLLDHFGSHDVTIGVTDDGCKLDHPDFDSPNKFMQWAYMQGSTLINKDSVSADPGKMYQSGADHGTCCCGVSAAETDGSLTVGAAPGCRLLPVKWQSSGPSLMISDSKMMTVLSFVADKVDVLSNSWGSSPEFTFSTNVINKITQLAQDGGRRGKGIVFLWAAGNENCPVKYNGNLDIPYDNGYNDSGNWKGVETSRTFENNLVGIPGVIHIAALASNAQRSHYSNYGEGVSLCAPSSNSHTYWRMVVSGLGILTTSGQSSLFDPDFGGTSSATPLVAGIAGLVISANPNLTSLQVISLLQRTADKDLNFTPYPKTASAPYDPNTAWDISPVPPFQDGNFSNTGHPDGTWSGWFGFGKVNAQAAVAEALRLSGGVVSPFTTIIQSSAPSISIPDNMNTGITDTITISNPGNLVSLSVDLDITHTYIGDLYIQLISPKGTQVILQDRNGASTQNIKKTYDIQSTPLLSRYKGEAITGNWLLKVTDLAVSDTGKLNSWTIRLNLGLDEDIIMEDAPGISIPDNNPTGIERSLQVNTDILIKEVEIGVDITHPYVGDLILNLVSPQGSIVTLQNRFGGDADNIIRSFNFSNTTNLRTLAGQKSKGMWKLKVSDIAGQDVGKLNKWSIRIVKQ